MPPPPEDDYAYWDAFPTPHDAAHAMLTAQAGWTYWVEIHGNCDGRHVVVWRRPRRRRDA